jgi:GntR family carbon starvation induced transcriptional regulator
MVFGPVNVVAGPGLTEQVQAVPRASTCFAVSVNVLSTSKPSKSKLASYLGVRGGVFFWKYIYYRMLTDQAPLSRTEWASDWLRKAVLSGELLPGARLTMAHLTRQLGVSQTPLREALQRLAAEGLLDYDPQRGARVAPISDKELYEIYQLRVKLEPDAVSDSVAHSNESWRNDLRAAFVEFDALSDDVPRGQYLELHRAFHRMLRAGCDSAWLRRLTDMLADHSSRFAAISVQPRGGVHAAKLEHKAIYDAALEGRSDNARDLIRQHMQRTLDVVAATLREDE